MRWLEGFWDLFRYLSDPIGFRNTEQAEAFRKAQERYAADQMRVLGGNDAQQGQLGQKVPQVFDK